MKARWVYNDNFGQPEDDLNVRGWLVLAFLPWRRIAANISLCVVAFVARVHFSMHVPYLVTAPPLPLPWPVDTTVALGVGAGLDVDLRCCHCLCCRKRYPLLLALICRRSWPLL